MENRNGEWDETLSFEAKAQQRFSCMIQALTKEGEGNLGGESHLFIKAMARFDKRLHSVETLFKELLMRLSLCEK